MLKKKFFTFFSALIALVLVVSPVMAQARVFGSPDSNEHPYVGLIVYTPNDVDYYTCSGTLLAPSVVLRK